MWYGRKAIGPCVKGNLLLHSHVSLFNPSLPIYNLKTIRGAVKMRGRNQRRVNMGEIFSSMHSTKQNCSTIIPLTVRTHQLFQPTKCELGFLKKIYNPCKGKASLDQSCTGSEYIIMLTFLDKTPPLLSGLKTDTNVNCRSFIHWFLIEFS